MRQSIGLAAAVILVGGFGCIVHSEQSPYPLYPYPHFQPRPAEELALLQGTVIAKVDDEDVSGHGPVFSLLPGCHIVVLQTEFGEAGPKGWSAHLTPRIYAIRMEAAHRYVIAVETGQVTGSNGRLYIKASDNPPEGKPTPEWPVKNSSEIERCKSWVPAPGDP